MVYAELIGGSRGHVYSTYGGQGAVQRSVRKVRAGQRVVIAYRGEEVAEIRPLENRGGVSETMARLEDQGVRAVAPNGGAARPSRESRALKRFLESRE